MRPVVAAEATEEGRSVDLLVATNRQVVADPDVRYGNRRDPHLHLTAVSVAMPKGRPEGTVQWPRTTPPQPQTDFHVTRLQTLTTVAQGRGWMRQHRRGGHVLLFVHGYNTTYGEAVYRFAQITADSGVEAAPVLFTWPSSGSLLGYNYDRESTLFSRTALEQTLRLLANDPSINQITILAHSMGSFLAMEALRQMSIRSGPLNPKIQNVILASPDIDIQVFARQFTEIVGPRPRFTIFVAQDDRALLLSRLIAGRVDRVGDINPAEEPYVSGLARAGIVAIDLTRIDDTGGSHHSRFADSPEIVQIIGRRLAEGQQLTTSDIERGGFVMVAAGALHTVGAVVTAPVAVLEAGSRPVPDISGTLAADPDALRTER